MRSILLFFLLCILSYGIFNSCSKGSNPSPPVYDTVTIVKTDTVAPPPDPTVNLTKGLLVYLPFNGSIADGSGNNNPTYAVGIVLGYDAHGYPNSAFNGDGVQSHVVVQNNGSITFDTAFSISFDFMINTSTRQMLVAMVDTGTGLGPSWFDNLSTPGLPNLGFWVNEDTASCDEPAEGPAQDPGILSDTTAFVPQLNTWYNMISIYNKGTGWVYINGQLIGSKQAAGTSILNCSTNSIMVGAWWNGDLIPLHGKLDEFRIYNRVLTPHEIVALTQYYQVTSEKVQPKAVQGR
jgi:Concanavalin A-like lectin/glucanases superfamily